MTALAPVTRSVADACTSHTLWEQIELLLVAPTVPACWLWEITQVASAGSGSLRACVTVMGTIESQVGVTRTLMSCPPSPLTPTQMVLTPMHGVGMKLVGVSV